MDATKLMYLKHLIDLDDINKFLSWKTLMDNSMKTIYDAKDIVCPVCLESGDIFVKTECGHYIHKKCLNNYLSNKCPMCRTKMYEEYPTFDTSTLTMRDLVNLKQMMYFEKILRYSLTNLVFNFDFTIYDDIRDLFIKSHESKSIDVNLIIKHEYRDDIKKYLDSFYIKGPYTYYNLIHDVAMLVAKVHDRQSTLPVILSMSLTNCGDVELSLDNTNFLNIFDIINIQ